MANEITRAKVLEAVLGERERQDYLHGDSNLNNTDADWFVILGEEVGEVAKDILEHDREHMFREVIECAAVCFAWAEAFINNEVVLKD
jgi:hypothetical protein|tara:strand:- start:59 stop:322 length:264 start_codon:yes stop_codon:yes gene_type:complete